MKLPNTIISLILNENDEKEWEKLYFLFQDEIEWKINHNKIMNIDISKFIKSIKLIIYDDFYKHVKKEYILNKNDNIINYEFQYNKHNYSKYSINCQLIINTVLEKNISFNFDLFEKKEKHDFYKRVNINKRYNLKIELYINIKHGKENGIFKLIKYKIEKDLKSLKKNPKLYRCSKYHIILDPKDLKEQKDLIDKYNTIYDIYQEKYDCKHKDKLYLVCKYIFKTNRKWDGKFNIRYSSVYNGTYMMDILSEIYEYENIEIIKKFTKILNGKYLKSNEYMGDCYDYYFDNYYRFLYYRAYDKEYEYNYEVMKEMIDDYYHSIAEQSAVDFIKSFN